MSKDML